MAKLFPETVLTVEGKVYRLLLDINAQVLLEQQAGRDDTLQTVSQRAMDGSVTAARLLFWAALQRHHPDVSLEQAGDLMSSADRSALLALGEAMHETTPDPKDVDALGPVTRPRKAQPRTNGTGGRSRSMSVGGG